MMKEDLNHVLLTLTERECGIIKMRYGLDDGEEKTLEEVGRAFNVSAHSWVGWLVWRVGSLLGAGVGGGRPCLMRRTPPTATCLGSPHLPTPSNPTPSHCTRPPPQHAHSPAAPPRPACPSPPLLLLQVTRERIRQIEAKAIRKLRSPSRVGQLVCF